MATPIQVTFDCADPGALAAFWAQALGYVVQPPPEPFPSWEDALTAWGVPRHLWNSRSAVIDPDGDGPRLFFQQVPEGKQVKNRMHVDLKAGGSGDDRRGRIDTEVERLLGLGATVLYPLEEWGSYSVTMQDPEGNEFCVD